MNLLLRASMPYGTNLSSINQLLLESMQKIEYFSQPELKANSLGMLLISTPLKVTPMVRMCRWMSHTVVKVLGVRCIVQGYSKLRSKVDDSLWDNRRIPQ